MLIGLKNQFAMEYEIVPASGSAILGHFCIWAHDQMIGNFPDVLVLTAIQAQIERSLSFSNRRIDPDLFTANKVDSMRILQEAIYGEGKDLDESELLSRKYGCFNLTELGISSFDGLYVFLVSSFEGQRLLWRQIHDSEIMEVKLPARTYDTIARDYLRAFSDEISTRQSKH